MQICRSCIQRNTWGVSGKGRTNKILLARARSRTCSPSQNQSVLQSAPHPAAQRGIQHRSFVKALAEPLAAVPAFLLLAELLRVHPRRHLRSACNLAKMASTWFSITGWPRRDLRFNFLLSLFLLWAFWCLFFRFMSSCSCVNLSSLFF